MTLKDIFSDASATNAISGAAGALSRVLALRESLADALRAVVIGTLNAVFLGPFIAAGLEKITKPALISHDVIVSGSAYIAGLGGVIIIGFVLDYLKVWARKIDGGK